MFAVGESEQPVSAGPKVVGQRADGRIELGGIDGLPFPPSDESIRQRTRTRQHGIDATVRLGDLVVVHPGRPEP